MSADNQTIDPDLPADRRTRELRVLYAVAEALNSASDVRQALRQTLALAVDLLDLRTGWVWLRDPDTGHFYSAAAQNLPPYLQEPIRMTGKPCWCLRQFQAGKLTPKNIDVLECSRLEPAVQARNLELTQGLQYHASIPLYFRDVPLGIMNVTSPTWRQLDRDELRLLSTIAYQTGIAIERARLAEAGTQLARAEERARLAREIHDTLAQSLTAIALHIEGAITTLEGHPERARERLQRALVLSRQSLEEARHSVLDLRSTSPAKPLPEALSSLARAFTGETGIRVEVHMEEHDPLPLRTEAELFRVAQEALTNVRRHAQARQVEISLGQTARHIGLMIRDDGRGFDPQHVTERRHGIVGMKERARLVGGRLRIQSGPGRGAKISVLLPRSAVEKP